MSLPTESESNRFPLAMVAGAVVVVLVLGGLFFLGRQKPSNIAATEQPLPFSDAEQAYTPNIHFSNPQMSRAGNTLNQEVTFIVGTVENAGPRVVHQVEVAVEFHDLINQVILRDSHRLLRPGAPLGPGQHQDFQINFDRVPNDWNRRYPSLRVTGLQLE